jgi:hypothetical protein
MDSVGLGRVAAVCGIVACSVVSASSRAGETGQPYHLALWADRDDDDADGRPDGEQSFLGIDARADLVSIDGQLGGRLTTAVTGAQHVRMLDSTGRPVAWGRAVPSAGWWQGLSPGTTDVSISGEGGRTRSIVFDVCGVDMRDGEGNVVDMAKSHASLERLPPARVQGSVDAPYDDFDALRVVLIVPDEDDGGRPELRVESLTAEGRRLDVLPTLALAPSRCAGGYEHVRCWASAPLRLVIDDADRNHPLGAGRSIKASLGGAIVFRRNGTKAQMIRVLGPRQSPAGPIGRLRVSLRPFVLRVITGGPPSIGGGDAGAVEAMRSELSAASAIWGQCGVTFGDAERIPVRIVDPPPSYLVALGGDLGILPSGGTIRLRVDGRVLTVTTLRGESIDSVAFSVAQAARRAGLSAVVSPNARAAPAVGSSVDVLLKRPDGSLVAITPEPREPFSTDPTLSVQVGSIDLTEGLEHFSDENSVAGTIEERTLLKAFDDGDPSTIEVVVVPFFGGGGRIGESFIASDLSSVRNVVVLDRAGIRMRSSSRTLAHELGHVLMDLPDHPDDYGVDTPTLLMDSDASDESAFGPRRLTLDECARVIRQAGPEARVPLLSNWPIAPIPRAAVRDAVHKKPE